MILHTIVPDVLIFQTDEQQYKKQRSVLHNGIPMIVQQTGDGEYEIVRVLSSNPQHFLMFEPGAKLHASAFSFMI